MNGTLHLCPWLVHPTQTDLSGAITVRLKKMTMCTPTLQEKGWRPAGHSFWRVENHLWEHEHAGLGACRQAAQPPAGQSPVACAVLAFSLLTFRVASCFCGHGVGRVWEAAVASQPAGQCFLLR